MLDMADFGANPHAPEFGELGVCYVRYGKAMQGSPPRRRSVLTVLAVGWPRCWPSGHARGPAAAGAGGSSGAVADRAGGADQSLRQIDDRFGACRDRAGLAEGLDLHSLRHSYVTHLIEDGCGSAFVQVLLSPRMGVHDVQHEPLTGADLRGGGGYLPPSITRISRRFDACSAGPDARLVA